MNQHHRSSLSTIVTTLTVAFGCAALLLALLSPSASAAVGGALLGHLHDLGLAGSPQVEAAGSAAGAKLSGNATITSVDTDMPGVGRITAEIPAAWNQVESDDWTYQGQRVGTYVAASPNLQRFYSTQSEPGVFIGTSHVLAQQSSDEAILNLERNSLGKKCQYKGRSDYSDNFYHGRSDSYSACSTGSPNVQVIATTTADKSTLVLIRITAASAADRAAAARVLATFQVLPPTD